MPGEKANARSPRSPSLLSLRRDPRAARAHRESLARRDAIERAADAIAEKDRITFVGIGTSLHAAQIAELWMRGFTAGRIWPHFEQSFELVNQPTAFGPRDAVVVITHTGTTTASVAALRFARAAGALTIAITGELASATGSATTGAEIRDADFHIQTCDQEVSFAYTKSYTTALAALALMILRIAERKKLLASGSTHALSNASRN